MNRHTCKKRSVTSRDVTQKADVSLMTVSRTLGTPDVVSPSTCERVKSAARELNYISDLAAGSLSSKRSSHVAVLLRSLGHTGFLRTVDGLSDTLRVHGYHLLVGDFYYSTAQQTDLLRLILGSRPEAIILDSSMDSPEARELLDGADIPIVETWDWPENPSVMVVGFTQKTAGVDIAESLVSMGYRIIGFLGGPATDPRDQRRGCSAPNELSIAGYGDFDFAPHLMPLLISVKLPRYRIGKQVADLIVDTIEHGGTPDNAVRNLGFDIIPRQSTTRQLNPTQRSTEAKCS